MLLSQYPQQPHYSVERHRSGHLLGRHVKINRGGPDSVEGTLLAVNGDVFVLYSENTVIYVNGTHVKNITEGTASDRDGHSRGAGGSGGTGSPGGGHHFVIASSFHSLLSRLHHQFVQINRGGPEKLEGFLAEISHDFILLIVGHERVRVPVYHIKTVNVAVFGHHKSHGSGGRSHSDSSGGKNRSGGGNHSRSGGRKRSRSRKKCGRRNKGEN